MKRLQISLIAILGALIIALCAFSLALFAAADDDEETTTTEVTRPVTLSGSSTFWTSTEDASISATREGESNEADYLMFELGKDGTITYKKNLAYSWYTGVNERGLFSLTIGFKNLTFEKYIISFQSQQYNKTEDNVTTNCLIFTPNEGGTGVNVFITQDEEAELEVTSSTPEFTTSSNEKLEISFAVPDGGFSGNYDITVNGQTVGQFENMFETYSKYVSSGTSACMPMTFKATFADDAADDATAKMPIYQMSGQSFLLTGAEFDGDEVTSVGTVNDDQAPVLCLDKNVNYLTFGNTISLSYTVIDVIASSPRSTVNYYVLTADQYSAEDFDYERTTSDEDESDLFKEVSSSTTIRLLRDKDTFIPSYLTESNTASGIDPTDGYEVFGLAKIYIEVTDVTGTRGRSNSVFLDWYVADEYKVDIYNSNLKNDSAKTSSFIQIVDDERGATYATFGGTTATDINEYKEIIKAIEADYQAKLDAAIEEQNPEDKKLYASSSNYFYLPDFSGYATDNFGRYTDLKYSIYYKASSKSSNTSLSSNQLAINVTEADVTYKFTIFVEDTAGNAMVYPVLKTVNGVEKIVYEEITTSDIWDDDYADLLPFFEFKVSYKPATVEDPEKQTVAYVGTTYSSVSFDIKGISNTYSTSYKLYTFDREKYYKATGKELTYDQFIADLDDLFNNSETRTYFTTVKASADLVEGDDDYDEFIDYAWSSSSVSFVPQTTTEFYVVELTLTDSRSAQKTMKYMGIRVSDTADSLYGESDWLQNNVASVVLLCIAGASFIALIALLVIKPKDKVDVDLIEEEEAKKAKKSKKAKKQETLD
jgi:hypothetical protein